MRINLFILGLITVMLGACSQKEQIPKGILQPEKMKIVLWDMMQVQSLSRELTINDSILNDAVETKILTQKVFDIHKIDSAAFEKSYNWYLKHPVIMKRLVDSLYNQKQRENVEAQKEELIPLPEIDKPKRLLRDSQPAEN